MLAMQEVLTTLREEGSSASIEHRIVSMQERNRLTDMDTWRAREARYRTV
jgi:hypothetical protein